MDQFTVPQFIDVEDKVFGPITTRQFIILLVGGFFVFLAYRFADMVLFIILLSLIGGFTLILAFVKINGQAFHYFLLNIIQSLRRPSRRVWKKYSTNAELKEAIVPAEDEAEKDIVPVKKASSAKIRNLSLLVNTGGYYRGE